MTDIDSTGNPARTVLHVIDSLDISGGAEKQLVANLNSFSDPRLVHELAILKTTETSRLGDIPDRVPVHVLFRPDETPTRWTTTSRLRALTQTRRPDLVHASLPMSSLATRLVCATTKTSGVESLVNISHEPVRTVDNPNVTETKLRFHTILDRMTLRSLSGFHAVSQAVAESWVETTGIDRTKVRVIPRGVDLSSFSAGSPDSNLRDEFGLPAEATVVLSVGRVEPQKGHRYLVEAAESLRETHPSLRFLIVGRAGNSSPAIEKLINDNGLGDRVILTGPRRDLPRLLASADIFAFPSLFEGNGGNAMIEAMASGLPIITTGHPPMTDLIPDDEHGRLIERCDSDGLAQALAQLADSADLRRRLGSAARRRAETFLSPQEVALQQEDWYLDLVSG